MKKQLGFVVGMLMLTTGLFAKHEKNITDVLSSNNPYVTKDFDQDYIECSNVNESTVLLKTGLANKRTLDSVYREDWDLSQKKWVTAYKEVFTYDENGNTLSLTAYTLDTNTNSYIIELKKEYAYDGSNNLIEEVDYDYQGESGLIYDDKVLYAYNSNGANTQEITLGWDTLLGQWVNQDKRIFAYDGTNEILMQVSYWDKDAEKWLGSYKVETSYEGDRINVVNTFDSLNVGWLNKAKSDYNYDVSGNLIEYIQYSWNASDSVWEESGKTENIFDGSNKRTTEIRFTWGGITDTWQANSKREYEYNSSGQEISVTNFGWNSVDSLWVGSYMSEFVYDAYSNKTHLISKFWDNTDEKWIETVEEVYSYDNAYDKSSLVIPSYYQGGTSEDFFNHKLDNGYLYYRINNEKILMNRISLYYGGEALSYGEESSDMFKIYPNPVFDQIHIEGAGMSAVFTIYDIHGKVLLSKKVENDEMINVKTLKQGLYIYNVSDGKNVYCGQLLKK